MNAMLLDKTNYEYQLPNNINILTPSLLFMHILERIILLNGASSKLQRYALIYKCRYEIM